MAIGLVALLVLLLLSALFSGSEVALFSLGDTAKAALAEQGDRAGRRVLKLLEQPRHLLITILILNTAANVATAIVAAVLTARLAAAMGWSYVLTIVLEMVVLTFLILVLSEITPKLLAVRHAPTFSRMVSGPLAVLHRLLHPVSNLLARSANIMGSRIDAEATRISSSDLKVLADVGEAHGTIEEQERDLIHSIVDFGDTSVREIMVSRLDVVALPVTAGVDEALALIRKTGHSRVPIYVDHLDNILGIVHAKDLLGYLSIAGKRTSMDWRRVGRPAFFVPPGKKLDELLRELQARKTHVAIVVDEYGGTVGLVTLEDVLEEIVGDIRDEHDETKNLPYERLEDGKYLFEARIDLDDVNELLDVRLDTEGYDFETLGGLIYNIMGAIPEEGNEITFEGLHMRVMAVENHRIGKVLVHLDPAGSRPPEDRA